MQQRAGLLFLSKDTGRILLILENHLWTVPTFNRSKTLLEDAAELLKLYDSGKVIPIELYHSRDKGFEYGTYVCLVEKEFLTLAANTICWSSFKELPKNIHAGLKNTLNNNLISIKIETILQMESLDL